MKRLANAIEGFTGVLLAALLLGALDGLLASSLPAEGLLQRSATFSLLDSVLAVPLALLAALVAALRPRSARTRRALAPLALLAVLAVLISRVVESSSSSSELTGTWVLEQPLPYLRSEQPSRSVALVTVDTLRADALEHMPLLRARAQEGVVYTSAHASSSWTLPAMASLHTGLPPSQHGAGARRVGSDHERSGLDADLGTLAQALRRRGTINTAVVSNPYLSQRYGLHRGFDRYIDLSRRALLARGLRRSLLWRQVVPSVGEDPTDRALQLHSRVVEGFSFQWVHYIEPHAPYTRSDQDPHEDCRMPDCFGDWREPVDPAEVWPLYLADLARLDEDLDRLLSEWTADGRLVVLVADHGEEFGEHGGHAHGHSFYEEVTHIPLIVWGGGTAPGRAEPHVDHVALHHMLLDYADGGEPLIAPALTEMSGLLFGQERAACTDGRFKCIEGVGAFDLITDPSEEWPLPQCPLDCALQPQDPQESGVFDPGALQVLGYLDP